MHRQASFDAKNAVFSHFLRSDEMRASVLEPGLPPSKCPKYSWPYGPNVVQPDNRVINPQKGELDGKISDDMAKHANKEQVDRI